jgi:uncharacterized protein YpuA (DUF1002 family)
MSDLSKDVLKLVKNKTGKQVSEQALKKIASGVTPKTLNSDAQLKTLIQQISKTVNVPVSNSTVNEIVRALKSSGGNIASLEKLIKSMIKK